MVMFELGFVKLGYMLVDYEKNFISERNVDILTLMVNLFTVFAVFHLRKQFLNNVFNFLRIFKLSYSELIYIVGEGVLVKVGFWVLIYEEAYVSLKTLNTAAIMVNLFAFVVCRHILVLILEKS